MSTITQYILVGIIVALAVVAVVRSVIKAAQGRKTALTACSGCKLYDVCQKPVCEDPDPVGPADDLP